MLDGDDTTPGEPSARFRLERKPREWIEAVLRATADHGPDGGPLWRPGQVCERHAAMIEVALDGVRFSRGGVERRRPRRRLHAAPGAQPCLIRPPARRDPITRTGDAS